MNWVKSKGMDATDSQTNFVFVKTGLPASAFREACEQRNVLVGRDFSPYHDQWMRISLGTMGEMERAIGVFDQVMTDLDDLNSRRREAAA
jgi:histidinol-phosphate/aromatic aminotransferase/cobyric acid decarboxylase-like protein